VRRLRAVADEASVPALPRHVRLRYDPVRGAFALLSPEKVFWPDETSLAILRRCDGRTRSDAIASQLALEYDAEPAIVLRDVLAFLQDWSDRMVVRL
jgi:pyrroloquinoline quinone biosynthesis protein D